MLRAREISRRSYRTTRQNVSLAFLFNGIGISAAATGLVYPVWAMVAMAASVTTVFVNSIGGRRSLLFDAIASVGRMEGPEVKEAKKARGHVMPTPGRRPPARICAGALWKHRWGVQRGRGSSSGTPAGSTWSSDGFTFAAAGRVSFSCLPYDCRPELTLAGRQG